jgi:carbonic anhydrase/acetyltransferase-like protein (isoleucine patch superfamily)
MIAYTQSLRKASAERDVTIGRQVMLRGCTIDNNTLVGIKAIIMNHAVIGKNCVIGAGALVPEGKVIPDGSLVIGAPDRVQRSLSQKVSARVKWNADGLR